VLKVLVVAPQPFFSFRGTPFSVYYRTLVMAEQGASIDFLTYGQGMNVDIPGVRIFRIPAFRFLGPVPIGPSKRKLLFDLFLFLRMLRMLVRSKYDIVHAHEEAVFFAAIIKPVFRFKLIYDMHSSLPQQLTNFSFTRSRVLLGLFTKLEDLSIRRADAVITICPDLQAYVLKQLDDPSGHFLIENSIFEPVRLSGVADTREASKVSLDIPPHSRLIVYAGTLESYQGVDLLIQSFAVLAKCCPDAFLAVVGGTRDQVNRYKRLVEELSLNACLIHERVDQQVVQALIARAAVQVSPRISGTNTPLKVYEQLASGVPLVATNIYSHTQVLDSKVAYLVEPEPEDMARGILQALEDGLSDNPKTKAARELYAKKYSRDAYEHKMSQLTEYIQSCAV
jgi:glycosyltransferase involved in cell wall biosynthesis